jgi:hypothetical protein
MNPGDLDPTMSDSQRLIRIETLLIGMTSKGDDHEMRIRRLEKVLYIGIGIAAAGGSAIGSYIGQLGGIN